MGEQSAEKAQPAPDIWDASVAPGGFVCSACGMPTESEPCNEHQMPQGGAHA